MTTDTLSFERITGENATLSDYSGKVVLIVNVASQCGYTPQYKDLESLYETYGPKGLAVLGFPCNQFGAQEPGTNAEIQSFCTSRYGVTFDMMAKIDVNGKNAHPLYQWLKSSSEKKSDVSWNFEKFLVDRKGAVIGRFPSGVAPLSSELKTAIEAALNA